MNFITENQTEYQALFTFWGGEEAEIVVCFDAKRHFTEEEKEGVFRQVEAKVEWIEENRDRILEFLLRNEEVRELFEVAQEDLEEEINEEQYSEDVYL